LTIPEFHEHRISVDPLATAGIEPATTGGVR